MLRARGFGYAHSKGRYDAMTEGAKEEWLSTEADTLFDRIYAQKPV
jgi:hypothetical protein